MRRESSRRHRGAAGTTNRKVSYQVMVMTTAAAAATRTAIAAVSTVMEVARAVISQSRRALKAPRWGGTVGIAGRESMGNALLNAHAQGTHTPSRWSVALLRRRGQEHGHQRDEGGRQPEQLGEISEVMGSRRPVHEGASRALVSRAPRPVHGFGRAGNEN